MNYNEKHDLNITVQITNQFLLDLMCTAVEGGINYWAGVVDTVRDDDLNYLSVSIVDLENMGDYGGDVPSRIVTPDLMLAGLQAFLNEYPDRVSILEDHDAEDADCVMQMAVFGELVYG